MLSVTHVERLKGDSLLESNGILNEGATTNTTLAMVCFCHSQIQLCTGIFQQCPEAIKDPKGKM